MGPPPPENPPEEERILKLIQKCPNMRVLRQIHARLLTRPIPASTLFISLSKLLTFCALSSQGDIHYARKLFNQNPDPNTFFYNTLIRGCSQIQNPSKEPFSLFNRMISKNYPCPNTFTFAFVLKACSVVSAFEEGKQVQSRVVKSGFGSSPFVETALVNFYAKCEEIQLARKAFDEISERNSVAWSAMISGYARMGFLNEALELFREMQMVGVAPDEVTMVTVVSACAAAGALDTARWVHAFIEKQLITVDLELSTALVNMYAKCGCIEKAKEVFEQIAVKDTYAWSSMIMGFAIHGLAEDALETFSGMEEAKAKPNQVTFLGVLSACAHSGLVSAGWKYWERLLESNVEPLMEHYGCMVDLLCRANRIEEAYKFVEAMPISPNSVIWRTLLMGCRKNKMLDRGEIVAERLLELEPLNAENYILVSNLFAACLQWSKVSLVRKKMKNKGIKAVPGCSSIEVDGFVHEFVMGCWTHPEAEDIRNVLREISERVHAAGHEPWVAAVLHDVGDEEKENALCEHSERLAIAFGLLKTKAPVVIRVIKNLRVCPDCHEVTKIISKLYGREIIVRDRVRFHKFVEGSCSCKDFW
ncbi:Pentatricopeptide repeat [Dillenia turbinata]|uniref:Pentatricopeptide repeat n=1 Tax=Dillenia turbinata TaxID=194707 RepID=A0AAN8W8E9_9MAGN